MKIHINLKREINDSYDIQIGMSLRSIAKDIHRSYPDASKFIITDSNVARLCGKKFLYGIREKNSQMIVVPAGEKSKTRTMKERLENKLLSFNADRDSLIIALGGGMIGDVAGFVAATLHRGVSYIQIPTTLLSQVDSSIGGKVAVDHPLGKNLIGAFYQPKKVYIDTSTLATLSDLEFSNGMAEVIKYAVILDKNLFNMLEEHHSQILNRHTALLQKIIKRCCELKKTIVEKDEKETDLRRILNFGHTIGHAIEHLTHYRLSHGEAVAIGMVAEARISASLGLLRPSDVTRLTKLVSMYHLPVALPSSVKTKALFAATQRDKKVHRGNVHYTLLEKIGKARIGVNLTADQALKLLTK